MIRKVSDLSATEFSTLLEVEYEMLPVLNSVGINLDEEKIKAEILRSPNQPIIFLEDQNDFIGLIRFNFLEKDLFIYSLNIRRKTRTFLRVVYEQFLKLEFEKIKSTVQITNYDSLSFHGKLGFVETRRNNKSVGFEIKKRALIERLLYFI